MGLCKGDGPEGFNSDCWFEVLLGPDLLEMVLSLKSKLFSFQTRMASSLRKRLACDEAGAFHVKL